MRKKPTKANTEAIACTGAAGIKPKTSPRVETFVEPANARVLQNKLPKGQTPDEATADMVVSGVVGNVMAAFDWCEGVMARPSLTAMYASMGRLGAEVRAGERGRIEAMLASQIVALNAGFTVMMQKAKASKTPEALDTFVRLSLRMQSQCRATAETLATMKAPPVFAKNYQANIANGPQQVNNGTPARGELSAIEPSKLLEAAIDAERVDTGTAGMAADGDSHVATVVPIDGTTDARGKGARLKKRLQGRR